MWRDEVGITEMMLAYIGEFAEFRGWSSWRSVVIDILSCHEDVRRQRVETARALIIDDEKSNEEDEVENPIISRDEVSDTNSSGHYPKNSGSNDSNEIGRHVVFENIKMEVNEVISVDSGAIASNNRDLTAVTGSQLKLFLDNEDKMSKPSCLDTKEDIHSEETSGLYSGNLSANSGQQQMMNELTHTEVRSSMTGSTVQNAIPTKFKATTKKYHACDFCGKQFERHSHKLRHERIHTGEKPYKCKFCYKSFNQKSNKECHERTHGGQPAYSCSVCDKTFTRISVKNDHECLHMEILQMNSLSDKNDSNFHL